MPSSTEFNKRYLLTTWVDLEFPEVQWHTTPQIMEVVGNKVSLRPLASKE